MTFGYTFAFLDYKTDNSLPTLPYHSSHDVVVSHDTTSSDTVPYFVFILTLYFRLDLILPPFIFPCTLFLSSLP